MRAAHHLALGMLHLPESLPFSKKNIFMTFKSPSILFIRVTAQSAALAGFLACYVVFSLILFFQRINPSLDGRSDEHIAADSVTYIYIADALREGHERSFRAHCDGCLSKHGLVPGVVNHGSAKHLRHRDR